MIFTPCQPCANPLVCSDLGDCYIKQRSNTHQMTPTPRTDAAQHEGLLRGNPIPTSVTTADFARQLEHDIAELNERLIERQETLMAAIVDLKAATQILTRCRNSAGRMGIDLYEDIQEFLHTQPSYRC